MNNYLAYGRNPIRGAEWTADPDEYRAYKDKPKFNSIKKATENFYKKIRSKEVYPKLLDAIRNGLALEDAVKMILVMEISRGDVAILQFSLLVEPYLIMLWYISREVGINPIIFDTMNSELTQEEIQLFMTGSKQ